MKDGKITHRADPGAAAPVRSLDNFDEAVLCHLDDVYRIALRLSGNLHEAEDLVQETFLRAHQAYGRFEFREYGAKPWLLKILHNVFLNRREQAGRSPVRAEDAGLAEYVTAPVSEPFDEEAAVAAEGESLMEAVGGRPRRKVNWDGFDEELKAAVESLPPEYRSALLLWALDDLSYKEIAEVLGCALGTVMSRLHRARKHLSAVLEDFAVERGVLRSPRPRDQKE